MTDRVDLALVEALRALDAALGESGQPHMIIGGIAVIARGVPRQTGDIDATVWAPELPAENLLSILQRHGIEGRIPDVLAFAGEAQVLLLEHQPTGTPIEISLAWLEFEWEALSRATVEDLGDLRVPLAQAEDLVIYKAVAWRDRDRADIERLLQLHDNIDLDHVRRRVEQFAEALDEPERLREFDQLLDRVR